MCISLYINLYQCISLYISLYISLNIKSQCISIYINVYITIYQSISMYITIYITIYFHYIYITIYISLYISINININKYHYNIPISLYISLQHQCSLTIEGRNRNLSARFSSLLRYPSPVSTLIKCFTCSNFPLNEEVFGTWITDLGFLSPIDSNVFTSSSRFPARPRRKVTKSSFVIAFGIKNRN